MGIMDIVKTQVTKLVDQHGDKVAKGMNKAGDAVAKRANKNKQEGGPDQPHHDPTQSQHNPNPRRDDDRPFDSGI